MSKKVYTIGISGASCSGKTWLANKIKSISPNQVNILTMDGYYRDVDFVNTLEFRHDNPNSVDYDKFVNDLTILKNGGAVQIPIYDYVSQQIVDYKLIQVDSVLIVEGLFVFYDKRIRNLLDMKIWTQAPEETLFARRMERDLSERGDLYESAVYRYEHDTRPAYFSFIDRLKVYADIVKY